MTIKTILDFWFHQLTPEQWWKKDAAIDRAIRNQFASIHHQTRLGELSAWRETAGGCLAEVIVLDQFSRNMFRDSPQAFACDGMALVLAQEAIRRGLNKSLPPEQRAFLYLPFMHSESLKIHQQALQLFSEPGLETNLAFEKQHADIIARFGRYPHRNAVLGRVSSEEEKAFLLQHPGF
ncbi:DUF924 family protein [Legionella spiritensis]|uniref:Transmembrane protein n=1 Tax=Legionella spiritensis TaxID=452 RepID=A0A0W0YWD4_LEGSP|nr:DUF924 family protein [Legionella spiritensis]KTD61160.1 hypothetical protein Lspi_2780 [Legionella spiritensis]SNV45289.1 Uncharacterized protein conserved in bacteria [Legionella spiritensis]